MFRRSSIAKRVIALLGVALTSMSCIHQTHLLCSLLGCLPAVDQTSSNRCQCNPGGAAPSQEHIVAKPRGLTCRTDGSCPRQQCPPNCWCRQAPSPQQAPSSTGGDSLGQLLEYCSVSSGVAASLDAASTGSSRTLHEASPQRATDACARLCRFLS